MRQRRIPIAGDTPGTAHELILYDLGPADAPVRLYLQAALHADEQPGTMVLHHLLVLLADAEAAGRLHCRLTLAPSVNPLGLLPHVGHRHLGRVDPDTGRNHNRAWPDLAAAVGADLALGTDATANVAAIRTALRRWIDAQAPRRAADALRLAVIAEAHDADIVLDLHCDDLSLIHIFTGPDMDLADLAAFTGAAATLTAADSGGFSFDEMLPRLYRTLAARHPDVPLAVTSATLEYRGRADVSDELGRADADALFAWLAHRGLLDADPVPAPLPAPAPAPFSATEIVRTPAPGLLAYRVVLGDRVSRGQPVADLIALDGETAFIGRTPILAGTDGLVLSLLAAKYVRRGDGIAKIVGTAPLPARQGYLLED